MKNVAKVLFLACLILAGSTLFAQVQIGATQEGCCSWSFYSGQWLGQQFTLNQNTNITSISMPGVGIAPFNNNNIYTVEIVDALTGGNVLWSATSNANQPVFNPANLTLDMGTYYLIGPSSGSHIVWNGSNGVTFAVGGSVGSDFWTSQDGGASWFNNPGQTPLMFEIDGSNATPEPGSLALMGSGLVGLAGALRRKFIA